MKRFKDWVKRTKVRIQHWLIKKLGGYTEQYQDNRRLFIQQPRPIHIHKLVRQEKVAMDHLLGGSEMALDATAYAKATLTQKITEDIIQSNKILFESREDVFKREIILEATCFVIPPEEAVKMVRPGGVGCEYLIQV